jgi:hypothetical protein
MINLCEVLIHDGEPSIVHTELEDPHDELAHSSICFETLTRLYYLRHGFEIADAYMTHNLTVLAFMTLNRMTQSSQPAESGKHPSEEDKRSTLILAAKGLDDQGKSYYLPYTLLHAVQKQMKSEDVDVLCRFVHRQRDKLLSGPLRARYVHAQYPVNIVDMTEHPDDKRLGSLIQEYANLAIEERSTSSGSEASSL